MTAGRLKQELLDRLCRYIAFDTRSDPTSRAIPSTPGQWDLARLLLQELEGMGLAEVFLTEHCHLYACLPHNLDPGHACARHPFPIGFIAHLDTAPGYSGKDVSPRIIRRYRGGPIALENSHILDPAVDPHLSTCRGHTLVTTDGTTLLGGDDKAGIAIIMALLSLLIHQPRIPRPEIWVAFLPDEEIGRGTDHFDKNRFRARAAYTLDGGPLGEISRENFNGDTASITFIGRDIHPGDAKDLMVNALKAASHLVSLLPQKTAPEATSHREPFIHPVELEAGVSHAALLCTLRAFESTASLRRQLKALVKKTDDAFPGVKVQVAFKENYRNMAQELEMAPWVCDHLEAALRRTGVEPYWKPVRGGTDGACLTAMGLPCPNIFTGVHNGHGPLEWVSADVMETAVHTLVNLARVWVNEA